jgi:hypothetical protein
MDKKRLISLAERLMEIPNELAEIQNRILNSTVELQELTAELNELETKLKVTINNALDETGKKKYSNSDARETAFAELKSGDLELTDLENAISRTQKEIQWARIDFDCIANEQKNIRSVLSFFAGASETVEL